MPLPAEVNVLVQEQDVDDHTKVKKRIVSRLTKQRHFDYNRHRFLSILRQPFML